MIAEVEAYRGLEDSASHAWRGPTPRNAPMFGPAGHAYVYFIYGLHHMFNVVTGEEGVPWAVLVRGLIPEQGLETMARLRGRKRGLADGPGKLCQALAVDRDLDGASLTAGVGVWLEQGVEWPESAVLAGPRVGIDYALPIHRDAPWRLRLDPRVVQATRSPPTGA
jgi:DNA-3-methyladenine glycosylase